MRSVHSHAPLGSQFSLESVRFIPVRPRCRRDGLGVFGTFPSALGDLVCACSIPLHPGTSRIDSCGFGPFRCPLVPIGTVRVKSVHFREPWGSSGSLWCVWSLPVRPVGRRVRSCAFGPFPRTMGVVGFAISPFACALGVVVFIRLNSARSRASWGSSCSFVCVCSIPMRPRGRQVRSGVFGPFPCTMGDVGIVLVQSVHSHAPWRSSCSFVCARSISRYRGCRSGAFDPFACALGFVVFASVPSVHSRVPWGS